MSVCLHEKGMCAPGACLMPGKPQEGTGSLTTGVTEGCKKLRGCWEPNLCPLQEE